ncbi:MAG: rRNA maturation RNase YbeY [Oscillospiraceae bacterium]|nr:rRNA maturation RNase YbeY [Oscillospiraceae bacterium]
MDRLKVVILNKQKAVKIPTGTRLLLRRCCHAVLELEHFDGFAQVDVSLVDNAQIKLINAEHRHIDAVTDVLSFPMGDHGHYDLNPATGACILGDIVLSVERAQRQAVQYGHSFQREIGFLTAHSMLHLLGYDHEGDTVETMHMREKEDEVMHELGLTRE